MNQEELLISEDSLEEIDEKELEELENIVEEYIQICNDFEEDVDDILERVNNSEVYEKLGVELHISIEYVYSMGEQ